LFSGTFVSVDPKGLDCPDLHKNCAGLVSVADKRLRSFCGTKKKKRQQDAGAIGIRRNTIQK
jgi:hypothetical protein